MKRFRGVFLLVFATLFVVQSSSAMSKKQALQVDVLVLDATLDLARTGAAGGKYAAWEKFPESRFEGSHAAIDYTNKIDAAAKRAALTDSLFRDASHDPLRLVSKEYTPWLERIVVGRFASHADGVEIARRAANRLAQSPHPDTWGPDLLWKVTTEAARSAIKEGASEEEIGRVAAQASWEYVLSISNQIGDAVRATVGTEYLAEDFDANQLLTFLKAPMDTEEFKQGLQEAQDFYKTSVSNIERKIKDQHLVY